MYSRESLAAAQRIVHAAMPPTPQQRWPLLDARLGARVWVKHENHTPVGAFKLRGGLVYFDGLRQREPDCRGVISATRGNHGQSVGFAARRHGIPAVIVVPRGNSVEKNAAMRALGVELIEHGDDFQAAREHAGRLAAERRLHLLPSFHDDLVRGVASYWLEFFEATAGDAPEVVFVPIGLGSGICACVAARAATGARTRIVGVVSAHATAYQQSFRAGHAIESAATTELADGMACRVPEPTALAVIRARGRRHRRGQRRRGRRRDARAVRRHPQRRRRRRRRGAGRRLAAACALGRALDRRADQRRQRRQCVFARVLAQR